MSLNSELLDKINAANDEFGSSDRWPDDLTRDIQELANREPTPNLTRINQDERQLVWMFKRGFTTTEIAKRLHHSFAWVSRRRPKDVRYRMVNDDIDDLVRYRVEGLGIQATAFKMTRRIEWVREMREELEGY